jgi:hypothetical protein
MLHGSDQESNGMNATVPVSSYANMLFSRLDVAV